MVLLGHASVLCADVPSERLTESPASTGDGFGRRVAISGTTMIVGMNGDDDEGADAGAAVIYSREGSQWQRRQKLVPAELEVSDFFGWSVALEGDVAVVGAPGDDRRLVNGVFQETIPNRGAAYVFRRQANQTWTLEARLEGPGSGAGDEFGGRVAVSGDNLAVAAFYHDILGPPRITDAGRVWLYRRVDGTWVNEGNFTIQGLLPRAGFGLALSGDRAVIGAPGIETAFVLTRNNGNWVPQSLVPGFGTFTPGVDGAARFSVIRGLGELPDGHFVALDRSQSPSTAPVTLGLVTPLGEVTQLDTGADAGLQTFGEKLAVDDAGVVYVAYDTHIRKRVGASAWVILAGSPATAGHLDAVGEAARFTDIRAVDVDAAGIVYVADGNRIRKVLADGTVTTLAGSAATGNSDGTGAAATFTSARSLAICPSGIVYVTDNYRVRTITQAGVVTSIAGQAGVTGSSNGTGTAALFTRPFASIDCTPAGDIVIGDGARLRQVTPGGTVTTLATSTPDLMAVDGPVGTAAYSLEIIHARSTTDVVFTDLTYVRRIKDGVVSTLAGASQALHYQVSPPLFGYAVAIAGTRIVVTAPLGMAPFSSQVRSGIAWVFDFDGTRWSPGAPTGSRVAGATERLGESVALSPGGDIVLGGANGCTHVAPGQCTDHSIGTALENQVTPVRLFRSVLGRWVEVLALSRPDVTARTGFGSTVAGASGLVVAGAPGGSIFPTSTAGDVFSFDVSTIDGDGDTLPDDWETRFGLDPTSGAGPDGTSGDPDGDGLTNAQEYEGQSHPTSLASATRYLAEGATGFFETRISIANPGTSSARVQLRFLDGQGIVRSHFIDVPAQQSRKIPVSTLPGLANAEFSTVVESDQVIVVDRQMWWDAAGAYGTHAEAGVRQPSLTWYFSEGATHSGFELFYLLQNPAATPAQVRVRFLRPSGPPIEKLYTVPARTRTNIWVDVEEFPDGSGQRLLSATDVSAVIEVTNGVPIIAERAMYLNGASLFEAGHESAGVTAPATSWFLAEGATGSYFDLFILLANPSATIDALVRATYLLPDGSTLSKDYTIPANSRANIWVDAEDFPGGPLLADTAVSTTLTVLNDVPIIVERSMWWPGPTAATWAEAHNAFGSTTTATRWGFAEGAITGAPANTETYLLVANTSASAGRVRVTLLFDDGGPSVSREYDILPRSRSNVPVRLDFPSADGRGFGAIVESIGASPVPIVVERAMYNDAGGQFWRAGSNALGTPLP